MDAGFGGQQDTTSVKAKVINLIRSVRTVARSKWLKPMHLSPECCISNLQDWANATVIAVPLIAVNTLIITYELILG